MSVNINLAKTRLLDISKRKKLSHLGSCISTLPILAYLYDNFSDDIIILSNGHSGLIQYILLEQVFGFDAEELLEKHGIHPCYDPEHKIYCSTGSLGSGLPIAVGYAIAGKNVHCVISDGECAEGSIWESLAFIYEHNIKIDVHVNMNGFSAYKAINREYLIKRLKSFLPAINIWETSNHPFEEGLSAHYCLVEEKHEKNIQ